jgi:hypothetical protein
MPRRPLYLFAAALCLPCPALSQSSVNANQVVEMATLAPIDGQADHAVVAVNDLGDVLVTWSASIYPRTHADAHMRRVEAAFLRRTSLNTWDLYPTVTLGEAEPTLLPGGVSIYPQGDRCRKPDVTSIGSDFVVAWQRMEANHTPNGRLECSYLEVPLAGGDMVVHNGDPSGIGYVIDAAVDCRIAGSMVDLAHNPGTGPNLVAAYASYINNYPIGSGVAFDFELRAVAFDFVSPGIAPTVHTPQTLDAQVAFDDFDISGGPAGGRILPDMVFDQLGNVVVAYEEFERGDRVGGGTPDAGNIHVQRLSLDSGVLTLLNSQSIQGTLIEDPLRRPNLFRGSSNDDISLAFGERNILTSESHVHHMSLEYSDSVTDATITDYMPTLIPGINEDVPLPLQFKTARVLLIAGDPPTSSRRVGYQIAALGNWEELADFTPVQPWRPAVDVLEVDPQKPKHGVLPVVVEGRPFPGAELRCFVEILLP